MVRLPGSSSAGVGPYQAARAAVRKAVGLLASKSLAKISRDAGEGQRWTLSAMGWGCPE